MKRFLPILPALVMGASNALPWMIGERNGKPFPMYGWEEITGKGTLVLMLVCILLAVLQHRWAPSAGILSIGMALMGIFRILTGETIAMTPLTLAPGVFIALGAAVVYTALVWRLRKPL